MQINTWVHEELSFWQKAVWLLFNPSGADEIYLVKQECANLIDHMNTLRMTTESGETNRLCSVAITEIQTAQMWVVKALTWKD